MSPAPARTWRRLPAVSAVYLVVVDVAVPGRKSQLVLTTARTGNDVCNNARRMRPTTTTSTHKWINKRRKMVMTSTRRSRSRPPLQIDRRRRRRWRRVWRLLHRRAHGAAGSYPRRRFILFSSYNVYRKSCWTGKIGHGNIVQTFCVYTHTRAHCTYTICLTYYYYYYYYV